MLCSVWKDHPWLCSWGLITPLYVECTVSVGVRITQSCSLLIHIIFFTIHRRLDTDHTDRSRFPSSSWQQGLQTTNQSPLSLLLQADWLASLQPVVECPSLTSLMPCAVDGPFIYYFLQADYTYVCNPARCHMFCARSGTSSWQAVLWINKYTLSSGLYHCISLINVQNQPPCNKLQDIVVILLFHAMKG